MTAHEIYTIGTTAVRLTPLGTNSGMDITLQNVNDSGYIYVGGADVTTSSYGFRIMPNHSISWELNGQDALYAISATNLNLAVIKVRLESGS